MGGSGSLIEAHSVVVRAYNRQEEAFTCHVDATDRSSLGSSARGTVTSTRPELVMIVLCRTRFFGFWTLVVEFLEISGST